MVDILTGSTRKFRCPELRTNYTPQPQNFANKQEAHIQRYDDGMLLIVEGHQYEELEQRNGNKAKEKNGYCRVQEREYSKVLVDNNTAL